MGTVALTEAPGVSGSATAVRYRVPDDAARCRRPCVADAPTGLHGALGPLALLACVLALAGCESQPGRAQEAGEDPFRRLDLVRVTTATPAPDFTVPSLTAGPLSLADFRERVVLLNFWATNRRRPAWH